MYAHIRGRTYVLLYIDTYLRYIERQQHHAPRETLTAHVLPHIPGTTRSTIEGSDIRENVF